MCYLPLNAMLQQRSSQCIDRLLGWILTYPCSDPTISCMKYMYQCISTNVLAQTFQTDNDNCITLFWGINITLNVYVVLQCSGSTVQFSIYLSLTSISVQLQRRCISCLPILYVDNARQELLHIYQLSGSHIFGIPKMSVHAASLDMFFFYYVLIDNYTDCVYRCHSDQYCKI